MSRIISFSGKKGSGKTELAKVCEKRGYKIVNFADDLKDLVCTCLHIDRYFMEENKDKDKLYDIRHNIINMNGNFVNIFTFISNTTNIDKIYVEQCISRSFNSIREILQIIGTDLIRKYNKTWHIDRFREKVLKLNVPIVCGDCRFINEKKIIEDLHGECWYIIRNQKRSDDYHISENELNSIDFGNNIILNDENKESFISSWNEFMILNSV